MISVDDEPDIEEKPVRRGWHWSSGVLLLLATAMCTWDYWRVWPHH